MDMDRDYQVWCQIKRDEGAMHVSLNAFGKGLGGALRICDTERWMQSELKLVALG